MTHVGGNGTGVIFSMVTGSTSFVQQKNIPLLAPGRSPEHLKLCQAGSGKLYGMTFRGGAYDLGLLFEYDPTTNNYTSKVDFNGLLNGASPYGSLLKSSSGKLYGMTYGGGLNSKGVLFEYDPVTNVYTKKVDFNGVLTGAEPIGGLVEASNGKLYGMTSRGGVNNIGVLFEYDPVTNVYLKKMDFSFSSVVTGAEPLGGLIQASNGKLYGMTFKGGTSNLGVLFEYDPIGNTYVKKIDFNGSNNGSFPRGNLMQASNGKLYAMTSSGGVNNGGVLFEYNPISSSYLKKVDFNGTLNGAAPYGELIEVSSGNLYGLTSFGGVNNFGVLFEYNPTTSLYNKKLDFDPGIHGRNPRGSLLQLGNNKLFGLTNGGGANNAGTIFEYNILLNICTKKVDLNGPINGAYPCGSLAEAPSGKMYGLTQSGGITNAGVLFEYNPATNNYTKKIDLKDTLTGRGPYGSLTLVGSSKLYGMNEWGGLNNDGTLFEYDLATNVLTKKLDFDRYLTGQHPLGSLVLVSGKLYGMTSIGGLNDDGVLFEYDPTTNIYTKKMDFDDTLSGRQPHGSLIHDGFGKLYGMTFTGGANHIGVLFEYDLNTNIYTKKVTFNGALNGRYPDGDLVLHGSGKMYGMTRSGGAYTHGVLFEYDPSTSVYTKKMDFNDTLTGQFPRGNLMLSRSGKLYGMTSSGGIYNSGVIFEYDPISEIFTKKTDFIGTNGYFPVSNNFIEICETPKPLGVLTQTFCQNSNSTISDLTVVGSGINWYSSSTSSVSLPPTDLLVSGTHYFATQNIGGCESKLRLDVTVIVNATPQVFVNSGTICLGDTFTIIPSGATTYSYSSGTNTVSPTTTSSYTITGIANGCENVAISNITVNALPNLVVTTNDTLLCSGETTTLSVQGAGGYTWSTSENGATIAVNPTITTTYSVSGTDLNGCSNTGIISQIVDPCTGTFEPKKSDELNIYPNPTKGFFTVELKTIVKIVITNVLSEIVLSEELISGKQYLDIQNQPPGIYFVKVSSDKGQQTIKIIKQ